MRLDRHRVAGMTSAPSAPAMRYDLVVVGTDGSATARPAEEVAIAVARAAGGEVLFVSAFQGDDGRHSAEQAVEEALARALAAGGKARTEVAEGEPAAVIMEVADRSDAKLVVVDDAGMGERRRLRLGGTADRISHSMPCDTLIVRTASAERSEDRVAYRKVLLATDGSSTATHAVRVGTELARGMSAAIEIVHVKDEVMGAVIMKEAVALLGEEEVPGHPLSGDVGKGIAEAARGFDLVVVGNKGMRGSVRIHMGKVPDQVSHLAPCDVLIVNTVDRSLDDLLPSEGAMVTIDGKKVAAYREADGAVVLLSPRCRHRGCTVGWNEVAGTWDCPCHGSRYDAHGKVFQGPATGDLGAAGSEERS